RYRTSFVVLGVGAVILAFARGSAWADPLPPEDKTALPRTAASCVGLLGSPMGQGPLLAAPMLLTARADKIPRTAKPPGFLAYCGVQSLYRALRALGKDVSLEDLIKPEYISSKQGSTVADLTKAGKDLGVFVEPVGHLTCGILRQVDCPVILHVKSDLSSTDYNHWVLFMGTEGEYA